MQRVEIPRVEGHLVKHRVLIVDDDLALSEMLGIVLRNEGLDAVHCSDGSPAMALFRESYPEIVLLT